MSLPNTTPPTINPAKSLIREYLLLGLLALLWGSSYLFIRVAVAEIPPITLIALRVAGATLFLSVILVLRGLEMPRDPRTWGMLGIQSIFNSIGAWTILAWGQQYVGAGLASVLNSTSPIFVFLFTALVTRHEALGARKLLGALVGLAGVVLIVGTSALTRAGSTTAGEIACLVGAMLYAGAAIYGKRLAGIGALQAALGTMIWATAVLVPLALLLENPLALRPGPAAIASTLTLAVLCTGAALMIYFRLVQTLGSLGVASQSYLRAGIGVLLGAVLLGEVPTPLTLLGLVAAIMGVALMNAPAKRGAAKP